MPMKEADLKKHVKEGKLAPVYFLYGEEPYLTAHYAAQIADRAAGDSALAEFNLQFLDGGGCKLNDIEEAVEALPVMAERKCVTVRDYDVAKAPADDQKRLLALLEDLPDSCVLVFRLDALEADVKKNAKWKAFVKAVDAAGVSAELNRKGEAEIVRLLTTGAQRRGCSLTGDNARLMLQRSGNDMTLLLGELEKLAAAAGEGGEIDRALITGLGVENLEASVFDLSRALLRGSYGQAYDILHRLFANKEEPVSILAVLSGAYVDLYRAKVARAAGQRAESLAEDFSYRGREWRLKNAARDGERLSVDALRQCLDTLAAADRTLKSSPMDKRTVLEQTAARLILLARGAAS